LREELDDIMVYIIGAVPGMAMTELMLLGQIKDAVMEDGAVKTIQPLAIFRTGHHPAVDLGRTVKRVIGEMALLEIRGQFQNDRRA
jgi:hypothetical protein